MTLKFISSYFKSYNPNVGDDIIPKCVNYDLPIKDIAQSLLQ